MIIENLLDAGSCLRILGNHIEVTTSASARKLVTQTEIIDQSGECRYDFGIGTTIELLVLQPRLTHQLTHAHKVITLDGVVHLKSVFLHLAQQTEFGTMVEEHPTDNLCEDLFSCTRDASVI